MWGISLLVRNRQHTYVISLNCCPCATRALRPLNASLSLSIGRLGFEYEYGCTILHVMASQDPREYVPDSHDPNLN